MSLGGSSSSFNFKQTGSSILAGSSGTGTGASLTSPSAKFASPTKLTSPSSHTALTSYASPSSSSTSAYGVTAFLPPPTSASSSTSPQPRLRSPERALNDPIAVGAYLAEEGSLSRIQFKHRSYVDRDRDSDDEDGPIGDDSNKNASGHASMKLNRKMLGVLTDEFYGCLRATEREMESDDKKDGQALAAKRQREEKKRLAELNAAAAALTETQFKSGPLTRALYAKTSQKESSEQRRREARLAKQRKKNAHIQEDDDEGEMDGLSRAALERKRKEEDGTAEDNGHRLYLPDCVIPPTITYLKGLPTAWYFSSQIDSSIKRKHSRNLHADKIIECLNSISYKTPWQSERPIEIVAVFWHSESHLAPIYMTRERMESFVRNDAQAMRPTGILQKFVPPASEYNNMIRVTWTPAMLLVERRTSGYKLGATRIRLDDRVQTYEVSTGLGIEVKEELIHEASSMRKVIQYTCDSIARHLAMVHGQTIAGQQSRLTSMNPLQQGRRCTPLKMTLYFKLAGQNTLFLLCCDELKWSKLDIDEVDAGQQRRLLAPRNNGLDDDEEEAMHTPSPIRQSTKTAVMTRPKETTDDIKELSSTMYASHIHGGRPGLGHGHAHSQSHGDLLSRASSTGNLTDGLDYFAHRRKLLSDARHLTNSSSSLSLHARLEPLSSSAKKRRDDLKCGHCAELLTVLNSHIGGGVTLAPVAPSPPGASNDKAPHVGKPYVDFKSILMYRLSLCAYLLPPAAVKRYDKPAAIAASQKIYSDFLWNLVRPILIPYYMTDEKEFKVHFFFQTEHDRELAEQAKKEKEAQAQAHHAGDASSTPHGRPSVAYQHLRAMSHQVSSSGYGEKPKEKTKTPSISVWDMKIYACKSCTSLIRAWQKQAKESIAAHQAAIAAAATGRNRSSESASSGTSSQQSSRPSSATRNGNGSGNSNGNGNGVSSNGSGPSSNFNPFLVIEELFDLLCEGYQAHQKLIPPTPSELAMSPHSTGVPTVLSAVPETPGGRMYHHTTGGGFLRSPNPYMVEQTYLEREQAAAIKRQIMAHKEEMERRHREPPAVNTSNSYSPSSFVSATALMTPLIPSYLGCSGDDSDGPPPPPGPSPHSTAAYFARGATPAPVNYAVSHIPGLPDDPELDEWTVAPGDRVRMALQQDEEINGRQPSVMLKYEPEYVAMNNPPPTKKEREQARLERLAKREERLKRCDQQREYEEWLAEQEHLKAQEPFQHVRSKLHEPLGQSEVRHAREQRRAERAREIALAVESLEHAHASHAMPPNLHSPTASHMNPSSASATPTDEQLLGDHETILRKLAALDPVRAEYLRARTSPDAPPLAPVKLKPAYHPDLNHQLSPDEEAAEQARLQHQLRVWYKRQVEREATAFARGEQTRHHATEDELDAEFDASSPLAHSRTIFGPPPHETPNHHRRFGSYLGGKLFVSAGQAMDEREGLGYSGTGLGNNPRDTVSSHIPTVHSLMSSSAGTPARTRSAGMNRSVSSTSISSPSHARTGGKSTPSNGRAKSAALRRSASSSRLDSSGAFPATQVAPTRLQSATGTRSTSSLTASRTPSASHMSKRDRERQSLAQYGYDNARAFATGASPYQREVERERELHGFIPAGWDSAARDSYSSVFGQNNSVGGPSALHKSLARSATKKKRPTHSPTRTRPSSAAAAAAAAHEHAEAQAHDMSDVSPLATAPPKSLAVFASAGSVGLGASEARPVATPVKKTRLASTTFNIHSVQHMSSAPTNQLRRVNSASQKRPLPAGRPPSSDLFVPMHMTPQSVHVNRSPSTSINTAAADERDEADEYDIDDEPIFEDDDNHRGHEEEKDGSHTPTQKRSLMSESSDDIFQRAEAILFNSQTN